MKRNFMYIILVIFFTGIAVNAQEFPPEDGHEGMGRMSERFRQMEKIKLIEELNLDEETAIRFFARRKQNMDNMKNLLGQRDSLLKVLSEKLKNNEDDFKITVKNILGLERKIVQNKSSFIENLGDILTEEQIAKLILFENRFKKELKEYFFRKRKKMR